MSLHSGPLSNLERILMLVIFLLAILLILCLGGCSSQKGMTVHILCTSPEGHVFHAEGMSASQAQVISQNWKLGACDVVVDEVDSSQKP